MILSRVFLDPSFLPSYRPSPGPVFFKRTCRNLAPQFYAGNFPTGYTSLAFFPLAMLYPVIIVFVPPAQTYVDFFFSRDFFVSLSTRNLFSSAEMFSYYVSPIQPPSFGVWRNVSRFPSVLTFQIYPPPPPLLLFFLLPRLFFVVGVLSSLKLPTPFSRNRTT